MQFCSQCGLRLGDGARYCGVCGRDAYAPATPPPIPVAPPTFAGEAGAPVPPVAPVGLPTAIIPAHTNRGVMIVAAVAIAASLAITAYVLVIAPTAADIEQPTPETHIRFVTARANIRNRPAVTGSAIVGQVERGARLTGALVPGPDARYPWLELADGRGFVSSVNLAAQAPPALARSFADIAWYAEGRTVLLAAPYESSTPLETLADRARTIVTGVTANGFVEVKRAGGGVGYFRAPEGFDPERQEPRAEPIAFSLNTANCDFGPAFRRLFKSADISFTDENNNSYRAVNREMFGLTVSAIASWEWASIIFVEYAETVRAAFEENGYHFNEDQGSYTLRDRSNNINGTELSYSAGIASSNGYPGNIHAYSRFGESYFRCGAG